VGPKEWESIDPTILEPTTTTTTLNILIILNNSNNSQQIQTKGTECLGLPDTATNPILIPVKDKGEVKWQELGQGQGLLEIPCRQTNPPLHFMRLDVFPSNRA